MVCFTDMGVFKLWDGSRQLRKVVCASTLSELKSKGIANKLLALCSYNKHQKAPKRSLLLSQLHGMARVYVCIVYTVTKYVCFKCVYVGSQKLGFAVLKIVIEEDGTEIDEDEEILGFVGSTMIGLAADEVWRPATSARYCCCRIIPLPVAQ